MTRIHLARPGINWAQLLRLSAHAETERKIGVPNSGTPISLSLYIIRHFGIGTPPDFCQTIHTDVQPVGCLDAALAVDIHRQHSRFLVSGQAYQPDCLLRPLGGHG